jgi:uncharacterized pyridoxal phosphate-containing UPF0001 family protein
MVGWMGVGGWGAFLPSGPLNEADSKQLFAQFGIPSVREHVASTPGLVLRGVMAVAPRDDEPRAAFERVRAASELVVRLAPEATAISAGMSGDFREAILEGATHLRIGTAITGKRPAPG